MSELVKETVIVNKTAVETVSETTGEVEEMNELVRETTSETAIIFFDIFIVNLLFVRFYQFIITHLI